MGTADDRPFGIQRALSAYYVSHRVAGPAEQLLWPCRAVGSGLLRAVDHSVASLSSPVRRCYRGPRRSRLRQPATPIAIGLGGDPLHNPSALARQRDQFAVGRLASGALSLDGCAEARRRPKEQAYASGAFRPAPVRSNGRKPALRFTGPRIPSTLSSPSFGHIARWTVIHTGGTHGNNGRLLSCWSCSL